MMTIPARLLLVLSLVSGWISVAYADTLTGEIRGKVLDVEGGVAISSAAVTLTHTDRAWKRSCQTDAEGNYLFLQLDPGNYSILIENPGYYSIERTGILVRLNTPKVILPPLALRKLVATPTQQITLRGEQAKVAVIDLSSPQTAASIIALLSAPGQTSLLSLFDAVLRTNFDGNLLRALPLSGTRSFDQLALFSPGVFRVPFSFGHGPSVGIGVGSGGQLSVNGSRPRSNNFSVDGSDNNDEDIGVRRQGFVALVPQTVESVEEIQFITAGFPAEMGRNSGAQVNAVSRAGGQGHHGELYGMFDEGALAARAFSEHAFRDGVNAGGLSGGSFEPKKDRGTQIGGAFGGPVLKPQLLYFLSWERQAYRGKSLKHFVVPAPAERGLRVRGGFIPMNGLAGYFKAKGITYSADAGSGVYSLYPLPNDPDGPFSGHDYAQARQSDRDAWILSGRMDWRLGAGQGLFGRYNFTDDRAGLPFTGEAINSSLNADTRTQNISLFLNTVRPRWANALRFSYGRTRLAFLSDADSPWVFGSRPPAGWPSQWNRVVNTPYGRFGPFGVTGPIGQLHILPYSPIGVDVYNFPQGRVDNTFQVSDTVTLPRGRHELRLGADLRRSQLNGFSDRNSRPLLLFGNGLVSSDCSSIPTCPYATSDGLLRGTDLAALGAPAGVLQTLSTHSVADTTIGLRLVQIDLFIQDVWKIHPRLTLNYGLRYELPGVPAEVNRRIESTFFVEAGQYAHLQPGSDFGLDQNRIIRAGNRAFDDAVQAWKAFLDGRTGIYLSDRDNLGPRIGFSWDPTGKGRMALRGSYMLAYDANLGAVTTQSRNVFPTFVPVNLDPSFNPPTGQMLNNLNFFTFTPTGSSLIRPGTLNAFGAAENEVATAIGTLFVQAPPFAEGTFSSNGLAFTLPEKRVGNTYAQQVVLSLERQIRDSWLLSFNYVGNRTRNLTRFLTPNAGLLSTPVLSYRPETRPNPTILSRPPTLSFQDSQRPNGQLGAYTTIGNSARSDYHSLQLTVEQQLRHGLRFRSNWTWSRTLDEVSDPFDGRGFFALPQNVQRVDLDRGPANFDVRHRWTFWLAWELPGSSKTRILRGWRVSALGELQTGQPYTVNTSYDRNGDGNLTDRLDATSGLIVQPSSPRPIELRAGYSPDSLLAPPGEDGEIGRNSFRSSGIATIDLAIWREFFLTRERTLELRAEMFNLFNRAHYGIPIRILESPGFGQSYDTLVNPRSIRLQLRFTY